MIHREIAQADLPLDSDLFFRTMLRELAGTLQDVVGEENAAGYVSVVGASMGQWLDREYRQTLRLDTLGREEVAAVCTDLKRRIGGGFSVVEIADDRIVFANTRCPFGRMVEGRPSLCMMTSNVFGRITADNLGYARVELEETIARGAPGCRVVVHLAPRGFSQPDEREYYRSYDPALVAG